MYQEFARVYDEFMETVPYSEWADHIQEIWERHDLRPDLVLDLACGTGGLAIELSRRGYDMIGIDLSEDMLDEAWEKAATAGQKILFVRQDMRQFELFGTVDAILCTCDSLNYILAIHELQAVFERAANYLEPGGLFVFDVNTEYKYREILGDRTFADTYEDAAFIWENQYDPETKENAYQVTFFVEGEKDCFRRYEELHIQKAYTEAEICRCLEKAGLQLEAVYDGLTFEKPQETSERLTFVVRKNQERGSNHE